MRVLAALVVSLAIAVCAAAAPNVTNATQKGSLLIFPDIRIDDSFNTLVRIENDGSSDVDVKCYWMDGNKNRTDFIVTITRNQTIWFDARTGNGTYQINKFPQSKSNGFDNPFLVGKVPPFAIELIDDDSPYLEGLLACWAVDSGARNQVKWNHLSGTATVYNPLPLFGSYEYNAYAFFVPAGVDLAPVGIPGFILMNGLQYDSCPLYQIAQFTPIGTPQTPVGTSQLSFPLARLAMASCSLNLQQDWLPLIVEYAFDVWNEDEVKFTGAYECGDSWHEVGDTLVDSAVQNFVWDTLQTFSARLRVQAVGGLRCVLSLPVGVLAVQSTSFVNNSIVPANVDMLGTTLAGAGKITGRIFWNPSGAVPEGGIR